MDNPYSKLSEKHFWNKSVANIEPHRLDPVSSPRFNISANTKIATAGSCFAQHISRFLAETGCNYLVCEDGDGLSGDERQRQNYGTFSARYGNIYTVAQLDQLYDASFGWRAPLDKAWERNDGRFVDPVRQQAVPDGFASIGELTEDRERHLAAVRQMFQEADVFIFTMGLTEAWRSRRDRTVYSAAPAVVAGIYDPELHEFVNFTVSEVYSHLRNFLVKLRAMNPSIHVLLTVSPVPLKATYECRPVISSNCYSKSVLRIAAQMAIDEFEWVDYFPSYEIISGVQSGATYFEDDMRTVRRVGVAHAMRLFSRHYLSDFAKFVPPPVDLAGGEFAVICDEEALDAVAR